MAETEESEPSTPTTRRRKPYGLLHVHCVDVLLDRGCRWYMLSQAVVWDCSQAQRIHIWTLWAANKLWMRLDARPCPKTYKSHRIEHSHFHRDIRCLLFGMPAEPRLHSLGVAQEHKRWWGLHADSSIIF